MCIYHCHVDAALSVPFFFSCGTAIHTSLFLFGYASPHVCKQPPAKGSHEFRLVCMHMYLDIAQFQDYG